VRAPNAGYCFFSGVAGVTGCAPPFDVGPGVAPALFSERLLAVECFELLAVAPVFGFAPLVGPLPASFVDMSPFVGPLPASAFGYTNAGADRPRATVDASRILLQEDMATSSQRCR
jgi:hypothetical protein